MIDFTLTEPFPRIFVVKTETAYEVASLFMRIQEFYESPYENIRNKLFTMDEYMDTYADDTGNFTYTCDWSGFNVPGHIVQKFFECFNDHLRAKELKLKNALKSVINDSAPFYLLGLSDERPIVMDHEFAHAFYYLDKDFKHKQDVITLIRGNKSKLDKMKTAILDRGYCDNVLDDELQAFLSTSSYFDLFKLFGFKFSFNDVKLYRTNFRDYFAKLNTY